MTPATPGHVFDVVFNPATGVATFTSLDGTGQGALGDLPVGTIERDEAKGVLYIGTDFGVARRVRPQTGWTSAASRAADDDRPEPGHRPGAARHVRHDARLRRLDAEPAVARDGSVNYEGPPAGGPFVASGSVPQRARDAAQPGPCSPCRPWRRRRRSGSRRASWRGSGRRSGRGRPRRPIRAATSPSARTVTRTCSPARKPVPATANGCSETTRSCGLAVDPPAASPAESPVAAARAATVAVSLRIDSRITGTTEVPLSRASTRVLARHRAIRTRMSGSSGNPRRSGGFGSRPVSRILSRVTIPLGHRSPGGSSGVPGSSAGSVGGACFALHRTGFGEPPCHHGRW